MAKPNIIYIHSHDTGRYVQPYGHAISTPNIQKLAEEGVLFRQAFCAAPTCSPSRACLLTGRWAHCNGMIGLAHRKAQLHDYNQLLPHTLKTNGYTTALAGMQHVAAQDELTPAKLGYDFNLKKDNYTGTMDQQVAQAGAQFINDHAKNSSPFFLDVGFGVTHRFGDWFNQDQSPAGDPRYCQPPAPLPDTPQTRQDMAAFKVAAGELDDYVGQIIGAVDKAHLSKNTLIICTTDHGIAFPGMKCNLTDHGIGVSLMMRGPGGFTGGKVIDAMVSHIDLFPTICQIAAIDKPNWLQGKSIMPLISGQEKQIHSTVFAEVNYHAAYEPKRCVRTQRYKYIQRWNDPKKNTNGPVLPNCDQSASKNLWLENGWADKKQDDHQLYDLIFDPNETNNLAHSATDILKDMQRHLNQWMADTNDPLLDGTVKPWPGQVTNDSNGRSPREQPHLVT